ncbi:MAG TPA: tyrosine-type recombinase/integrase [Abditibacteriaceae bacterium]|jgi:site-specific recombinase XerD
MAERNAETTQNTGVTTELLLETFGRFLRMEVAHGNATDDTIQSYEREVKLWIQWCRDMKVEPGLAQRDDLVSYRDYLKSRNVAFATRKMKMSVLRRFYDSAVFNKLLAVNPAASIRSGTNPTMPEDRVQSLTKDALATLFHDIPVDTITGQRDRAIVGLMAVHGLRRIEIHRLNQSDVQMDGTTAFLDVWGKSNRRRRVYLRPDTHASIVAYQNSKLAAGLPVDALFLAHDNRARGQRISRRGINMIVDRYLEINSLKRAGLSCQALRHTHGILAIAGGARVEHLRDSMGHNDLETTAIYVKVISRKKNNPANFIDVEL